MKNFIKKTSLFVIFLTLSATVFLNAQQIIKYPYLVEPGRRSVLIRWELNAEAKCQIEFGRDTLAISIAEAGLRGSKSGGFLYDAVLSPLKPGKRYFYRLVVGKKRMPWCEFKTDFAANDHFKFAVMGDSRSHPEIFSKIMEQTEEFSPELIISMGDLVAHGERYPEWQKYYFDVVRNIACSVPIVSTLGDHETDYKGKEGGELFRYFLRKNEPMDKQYFSFDYGNAHFVSLDYRYPEDAEMVDWFIKDISASGAKWKFVFMHRPCYNMGGHRSDWGRGVWPDLFEDYHIDVVFAGHSHLYERFQPTVSSKKDLDFAVTYITTGGAGAGLYDVVKNPLLAVAESVNHFLIIDMNGDTLRMTAIRMDGSVMDELLIVKKDKKYDEEYLQKVVSREKLELVTGFNSEISRGAPQLPLRNHPLRMELNFSSNVSEDIPFELTLCKESRKQYHLADSVKGVLPAGKELKIEAKVYRKGDIVVNQWGEYKPELRFKLIYLFHSQSDTLVGGPIEYDPR